MSIRRTRQQKENIAVRREETGIRYQPTVAEAKPNAGVKKVVIDLQQKHFMMDLRKTAISTIVVLLLLAFVYWMLR